MRFKDTKFTIDLAGFFSNLLPSKRKKGDKPQGRYKLKGASNRWTKIKSKLKEKGRLLDRWLEDKVPHITNYAALIVGTFGFGFVLLIVIMEFSLIPLYVVQFRTQPPPELTLVSWMFFLRPFIHLCFAGVTIVSFLVGIGWVLKHAFSLGEFYLNHELQERIREIEMARYDGDRSWLSSLDLPTGQEAIELSEFLSLADKLEIKVKKLVKIKYEPQEKE